MLIFDGFKNAIMVNRHYFCIIIQLITSFDMVPLKKIVVENKKMLPKRVLGKTKYSNTINVSPLFE